MSEQQEPGSASQPPAKRQRMDPKIPLPKTSQEMLSTGNKAAESMGRAPEATISIEKAAVLAWKSISG